MTWNKARFGYCAELIRNTVIPEDVKGANYIGLEHISQGGLSLIGFGKSEDVISQKIFFKQGDILFGKLRPYFRKVVIAPFDGVCSTDIWVIRSKSGYDQKFIFYWMASKEFIENSSQASEGTKMPRAKWDFVSKFEKELPPLKEQRAIADVLSALDDKIELNRQMNQTLEQLAQIVFTHKFIDNPESENWEKVSVLEIADLLSGGTPKTSESSYWNGDIDWVSAKDVSNCKGLFILGSEKKITKHGLEKSSTKILPSKTTIITARGTVGAHCLLPFPMAMNQTNYGVKAKDGIGDFFIYFLVTSIIEELKRNSYGTIFDTITTKTFQNAFINLPPKNLIDQFEETITPFMDKILTNQQESQTLSKLRDTLLPKLMSGQVRVRPT